MMRIRQFLHECQGALAIGLLLASGLVSIASASHPSFNLYDKDGNLIDPIHHENVDKPLSTKQTCGLCHDYDQITSGYHFQTGWNVISDTFGIKQGQPWVLSDGMLGKWELASFRQLARKHNHSADEIDLTTYDFVGFSAVSRSAPTCGSCHPGGGGLEYDRAGNRYDEFILENPSLKDSLDGDYYQSNWDKSGVVEADCFICHFRDYNFDERITQLKNGNYQWAVVSGSGIGIVNGAVSKGEAPMVLYNQRFFNQDGTISPEIAWPPPDDNCVFCHGKYDVRKRGFSWNDIFNPDVHNEQGISCAACHPSGPEHQFAKGDPEDISVANNLDNTMKDCAGCHYQGYLGATVPKHTQIRPSHLKRIACETCHIPSLGRTADRGFDVTTGSIYDYTNPPGSKGIGERGIWQPIYYRRADQIVYPENDMQAVYWGNLDSDGIIYPLFEKEHAAGWKLFADQVKDDNQDGEPEVNTEAEIMAGMKAFGESLKNNQRFGQTKPVYIKGGKIYGLDPGGKIIQIDHGAISTVRYAVNHNIAPARKALGATGCKDCHAYEAHFFKGKKLVDMYGVDGKPEVVTIGRALGCNPFIFVINSFHQRILSPVISFMIIFTVFLITLHYHRYGPKRVPFVYGSGEVKRFTFLERGIHLFRLISFLFLASTGLIMAFNWSGWQNLLFKSPQQMLTFHIVAGFVFIVTTIMGILVWLKDATFTSYDKEWVKRIGGYLGYKGRIPAGRFNAGQKMFYWYTAAFGIIISITGVILTFKSSFDLSLICFISTVHNLIAFFLVAGVLAHAYLGTIANPGTWRVLIDGYVTKEWARHHHPNWYGLVSGEKPEEKAVDVEDPPEKPPDKPKPESEKENGP